MQIERARCDVGAPRDVRHAQRVVAAARDLAEHGGLDRGVGAGDFARAFALYIRSSIHCRNTVANLVGKLSTLGPSAVRLGIS